MKKSNKVFLSTLIIALVWALFHLVVIRSIGEFFIYFCEAYVLIGITYIVTDVVNRGED